MPKRYVRSSVTLNGNIAPATQGETVPSEILGSGDGKRPNQQFALRRGPLTYVPAATASGSQSTLSVYVDQVRWRQVASFYGLDPRSRSYIVRTDETGQATVIFGDGQQGARLPSGQENVVASYRVGIGPAGEVPAGALTQLKNQPMRVNTVVNPLAATGAAPPDTPESARIKAPLTVSTLGRIVSLQDYDDFTRTFAGVGRSRTSLLWNGRRPVMHITILGTDGQPIADDSALSTSLAAAIDALRDPAQPVLIQSGDKRTFGVTAKVLAQPDYQLQPIQDAVRAALAALLAIVERQLNALEDNMAALYDNWFIETCEEWVVPYIADLLDVQGLSDKQCNIVGQRARVADTLSYRRRKGTTRTLEYAIQEATN